MQNEPCFILLPHGSGLEKRQASLQLCISPQGPQLVRLAIIFKGTGQHDLCAAEKCFYSNLSHLICVYFQPNAWADELVMLDWLDQFSLDTASLVGPALFPDPFPPLFSWQF